MSTTESLRSFSVDVLGLPAPKGSKRAFVVKGRAIVTDAPRHASDKLSPWKLAVTSAVQRAIEERGNPPPMDGPLVVSIVFWLPRPNSAPKRVIYPATKPDIDKLARAALDLCSKVVWVDDARIVSLALEKRFALHRPPGMTMRVAVEKHSA